MGWRARCIFGVGFLATAWAAAIPIAHGDVTVEQKAVEIEHKTFDPNHRPDDMPALKPGEAAVTESRFDCDADISYKIIERKTGDETCAVSLRVQAVHVTSTLKIIVWLPTGVPQKLAAHEEGHCRIDQHVYDEAKIQLEKDAHALEGQILRASAADCDLAAHQATQSAADAYCKQYLQYVAKRVSRVNDEYDRITAHGTKANPTEDEAIKQSLLCAEGK